MQQSGLSEKKTSLCCFLINVVVNDVTVLHDSMMEHSAELTLNFIRTEEKVTEILNFV